MAYWQNKHGDIINWQTHEEATQTSNVNEIERTFRDNVFTSLSKDYTGQLGVDDVEALCDLSGKIRTTLGLQSDKLGFASKETLPKQPGNTDYISGLLDQLTDHLIRAIANHEVVMQDMLKAQEQKTPTRLLPQQIGTTNSLAQDQQVTGIVKDNISIEQSFPQSDQLNEHSYSNILDNESYRQSPLQAFRLVSENRYEQLEITSKCVAALVDAYTKGSKRKFSNLFGLASRNEQRYAQQIGEKTGLAERITSIPFENLIPSSLKKRFWNNGNPPLGAEADLKVLSSPERYPTKSSNIRSSTVERFKRTNLSTTPGVLPSNTSQYHPELISLSSNTSPNATLRIIVPQEKRSGVFTLPRGVKISGELTNLNEEATQQEPERFATLRTKNGSLLIPEQDLNNLLLAQGQPPLGKGDIKRRIEIANNSEKFSIQIGDSNYMSTRRSAALQSTTTASSSKLDRSTEGFHR